MRRRPSSKSEGNRLRADESRLEAKACRAIAGHVPTLLPSERALGSPFHRISGANLRLGKSATRGHCKSVLQRALPATESPKMCFCHAHVLRWRSLEPDAPTHSRSVEV